MTKNQYQSLDIHTIYKTSSSFFPVTSWVGPEGRVPITAPDRQQAFKHCICRLCFLRFLLNSSHSDLVRVQVRPCQSQCLSSSKPNLLQRTQGALHGLVPHYLSDLMSYYRLILCSAPAMLSSSLLTAPPKCQACCRHPSALSPLPSDQHEAHSFSSLSSYSNSLQLTLPWPAYLCCIHP